MDAGAPPSLPKTPDDSEAEYGEDFHGYKALKWEQSHHIGSLSLLKRFQRSSGTISGKKADTRARVGAGVDRCAPLERLTRSCE